MPTGHGYLIHREWSAQSTADAAVTTSTAGFQNPQYFPGADALRITFSQFTKDAADNTCAFQLWLKTYAEDGTEFVVPYDESLAEISTTASTTDYVSPSTITISDVPSGSWYVRMSETGGTTPTLTGSVKIQYIQEND